MKIMWLTVMTQVLSLSENEKDIRTSGGWIAATAKNLEEFDDVEKIIIVSINRDIKEEKRVVDGKKVVYFVRANQVAIGRDKVLEEKLCSIVAEENPDVIDVQGTEFSFGDSLINCNVKCPVCVTIQGLAGACADVYVKGLPLKTLFFRRAKRDNKTLSGLLERKIMMHIRAVKTDKMIKKVKYCIGRTHFDKAEAERINPEIKYFSCNRILRSDFYSYNWDVEKAEKHKLFGIRSEIPYKGLHYAVKVIAKLKEKYPDVLLEVPGGLKVDEPLSSIASYPKYINELIEKYGVRENISFLPSLNPQEIAEHMMSSRAFYQYSVIENSPNSLAEAQVMGVPSVASDVGGTSSYAEDGVSGLLFEVDNIDECVEKISRIFEEDELCLTLSANEKKLAEERHDVKTNTEKLILIYREIISKNKER
ncbi:MAG: glycosyltransferase [Clostridia bacterium]|nr:glycosyltransferase [Clostridia bacterium]